MGPCFFHPQWETASEIYSKYWSLLILLKVMVNYSILLPLCWTEAHFSLVRGHCFTLWPVEKQIQHLENGIVFFQYHASHNTPWIAKPTPTKMAENHQTTCFTDALLVWMYCVVRMWGWKEREREREQVTHKPCKAPNEHETLKFQKKMDA